MYDFTIKDSRSQLDASTAGGFLLLAALFTFTSTDTIAGKITVALLIAGALFSNTLLTKFKIPALVLQAIAAVLMGLATHSLLIPSILVLFAFVLHWSYVQPKVSINAQGVVLARSFQTRKYGWDQFSNVVLNAGLLTLDFANNKVLQLEVDAASQTDEPGFNQFCASQLAK